MAVFKQTTMLPLPPPAASFGRQTAEPQLTRMETLYYKLKWWLRTSFTPQPLF